MVIPARVLAFLSISLVILLAPAISAGTISFTGDLRTDATFTSCGAGCTLGVANTDADYAQWAAAVETFSVAAPSAMQAVTFSYGGGINGAGTVIPQGGFEPYLSLFDSSGFLASTFFGTTCPTGTNTNTTSGQCFDVSLAGGTLAPGTYQIAVSAFENLSFAENLGTGKLADGFTGLGNLASGENLRFAFDVDLSSTNPVAEPETLPLVAGAGILLYIERWRQAKTRCRRSPEGRA